MTHPVDGLRQQFLTHYVESLGRSDPNGVGDWMVTNWSIDLALPAAGPCVRFQPVVDR
jgi:hypothetical protein